MDSTYELITNYLDEKQLEPKDVFVEQSMKDPVTTPEDDLVIEVSPRRSLAVRATPRRADWNVATSG